MARNIDLAMANINKKFGEQLCKEGTELIYVDKIPFSSPTANYMTYGGVPIGKATEFFGGEGGGKTTSALDIVGNAQKKFKEEWENKVQQAQEEYEKLASVKSTEKKAERFKKDVLDELMEQGPKVVVYVDAENTLDVEWAALLGVNTDEMILIRPQTQTAEQVLQMMIDLIDTGNVGLMVLDSVPCLVPQVIFEESMEKKSYGGVAGPMSVFCAKVTPYLTKHKTALIMINQIREDLSNPYNTASTPGGKALKHLYSLRLRFKKDSLLDDNNRELPSRAENPAGNIVQVEIVKTKVCKPNRRLGYYTLNYTNGIDVIADTVTMALKYGYIVQAGAWFTFMDPETGEIICDEDGVELKFQGMAKLLEFIRNDEYMLSELVENLNSVMCQE